MAIIAPDVGIDLGTCNTRIYVKHKGAVLDEPTLIVTSGSKNRLLAVGEEARLLMGRTTEDVNDIHPLLDGKINDFEMTQEYLLYMMKKAIGVSRLVKPRMLVSSPCRMTAIEKRVLRQAALYAGARQAALTLIEKPFAAAFGCGLPVFEPTGSMVVDIGGGMTEAAVISLGGIVISRSVKVGGDRMNSAVIAYIKKEFNMLIGSRTAENIKIDLGAALPLKDERRIVIRGRDMITNLPQTAEVSSSGIYEALHPSCEAILAAIRFVLERTPPELAGDVLKGGIHLTGGGSQLFGLDQYIASELNIPVLLAKDPASCTLQGLGNLVEQMELLPRLSLSSALRDEGEG